MLSRRAFFSEAAAIGATLLGAGSLRAEQPDVPAVFINDTLERIASVLKKEKLVADADLYLVDAPTKGIVQWRWAHYRPDVPRWCVPYVERTNRQLFHAMDRTRTIPGAQLDSLLHEGLIHGRGHLQFDKCMATQRELIRTLFTRPHPFVVRDIPPSPETVEKELYVFENLDRPVFQNVYVNGARQGISMSPLTRLGAGHVLSVTRDVWLEETECPVLDAKAEQAERSGSEEEHRKWVMEARDAHFTEVIAACRRAIAHFLVGFGHDLTDDIENHNTLQNDNQMSHLVLTMQGVLDAEKMHGIRHF